MRLAVAQPERPEAEVAGAVLDAGGFEATRRAALMRCLVEHVEALRGSAIALPGNPVHLETEFQAREGSVVVAGIFDRVEKKAASAWTVIDYKFGEPRRLYEDQIGVYAWALRRAGCDGKIDGVLAFVRSAGVVLHRVDAAAAARRAETAIVALGEAVASGVFEARPGAVCAACPWQSLCPYAPVDTPG